VARTWLSIRVDLVDGAHGPELWPRPGRILLARPGISFGMLADAIKDAFARWDGRTCMPSLGGVAPRSQVLA